MTPPALAESTARTLPAFTAQRTLLALLTLILVSVVVFLATQALPGDAARAILGRDVTPERLAEVRAQLNLDESRQ